MGPFVAAARLRKIPTTGGFRCQCPIVLRVLTYWTVPAFEVGFWVLGFRRDDCRYYDGQGGRDIQPVPPMAALCQVTDSVMADLVDVSGSDLSKQSD